MELIDLLNMAACGWKQATGKAGPDLDLHWAEVDGEIVENPECERHCYDPFSHTAVSEIISTYESDLPDFQRKREAVRVIDQLAHWMWGVAYELRSIETLDSPAPLAAPRT